MNGRYQLLPPLTDQEYADLKADIDANGIEQPIIVDDLGQIIDGHHRAQIADELGIDCPCETRVMDSEDAKRDLALRLNVHRRSLTREQKRELLANLIKAAPEKSDRQHAAAVGVSHHTASAVRGDLESGGQIAHQPERIGADGVAQPAKVTHRTTESETVEYTSPGSPAPHLDSAPGVEQPSSEPGALDPVNAAIERYPALNIDKASDADILKVADALDKLTDDAQLAERIENGRRWLVAKSEGRLGGSTPLDPCQSGDEITEYCIEAATDIRGAGGADAFAAAWESADNLTRDNWRASLYSLETVLNDLRSVTQAKQLRSV